MGLGLAPVSHQAKKDTSKARMSVVLRRAAGTATALPSVIMQSQKDPCLADLFTHALIFLSIPCSLGCCRLKGLKPSPDLRPEI